MLHLLDVPLPLVVFYFALVASAVKCAYQLFTGWRASSRTDQTSNSRISEQQRVLSEGRHLIAHDHRKRDLIEWARFKFGPEASKHTLFATGTTGRVLAEELGLPVTRLQSGPIGGDQQIGAMIVDGSIDFLDLLLGYARIAPDLVGGETTGTSRAS